MKSLLWLLVAVRMLHAAVDVTGDVCGNWQFAISLNVGIAICYNVHPSNRSMDAQFHSQSAETWKDVTITLMQSSDKAVSAVKFNSLTTNSSFECLASGTYFFKFKGTTNKGRMRQIPSPTFDIQTEDVRWDVDKWRPEIDIPLEHKTSNSMLVRITSRNDFDFKSFKLQLLRGAVSINETEHEMKVQHEIPFQGLEPGNYSLLMRVIDCRCEMLHTCTIKFSNITISEEIHKPAVHGPNESGNGGIWIGVGITLALLATAFVALLHLRRGGQFLRPLSAVVPTSGMKASSPGALAKMPQVVLVYDVDDALIRQRAALLRRYLSEHGAPQVHDYADEAQRETVATEGVEWFPKRIADVNIKVIVIQSKGFVSCQNQILLHALSLIQSYVVRNPTSKYSRIYQIRYSDVALADSNVQLAAEVGTPFTVFTLPNDELLLLNQLRGN